MTKRTFEFEPDEVKLLIEAVAMLAHQLNTEAQDNYRDMAAAHRYQVATGIWNILLSKEDE